MRSAFQTAEITGLAFEIIAALESVLAEAWQILELEGEVYIAPGQAHRLLALRIREMVGFGVHDPEWLRDDALAYLATAQSALLP